MPVAAPTRTFLRAAVLAAAVLALASAAPAITVGEVARIQGQGESVLQGVGLVVGLNGTGDSGKDLVLARPLAEVLRKHGLPIAAYDELKNARSVALVMVTCTIPESGARIDDAFDVKVSVLHSASSLRGGELYITALTGPFPGAPVYAFAQGGIDVEDSANPRTARVRRAARMVRDIATGHISGDTFNLVLRPHFAGWPAATGIASQITQNIQRTALAPGDVPPVAIAADDRTIHITIPRAERQAIANFIADVLATDIDASLLRLPAQVVCNADTGAIVITGDVRISPVVIRHKDLVITATTPAPIPTPENPLVETRRTAALETGAKPAEKARLQDLLAALERLNIPASEQIGILEMLNKAGKLHARLIID